MRFNADDIEDRSEQRAERATYDTDHHDARKDNDVLEQYRSERFARLTRGNEQWLSGAPVMPSVTTDMFNAADSMWGAA